MNLILAEEVLSHLHNWFVKDTAVFENVEVSDGNPPDDISAFVPDNAFYRLQGTYLNDGLHRMGDPDDTLQDESIDRVLVSVLAIPRPLLLIIDEIEAWNEKYGEISTGPFFSEKFGGYEYQIRGFSSYGVSGSPLAGWRLAFANRLNPWRRMY